MSKLSAFSLQRRFRNKEASRKTNDMIAKAGIRFSFTGIARDRAVAQTKIDLSSSSWSFLRINHGEAKGRQFQLSEPKG